MSKFRKTTHKTVTADLRAFADYLDEAGKDGTALRASVAVDLNKQLDQLLNEDAFGTEGQCDPRGDHRG